MTAAELATRLAYRPGDPMWGLMVSDTLADVAARIRRTHEPLDQGRRDQAEAKLTRLVAMVEQQAAVTR